MAAVAMRGRGLGPRHVLHVACSGGVAGLFLALFLVVPLVAVFVQAFAEGTAVYWAASPSPRRARAIAAHAGGRGVRGAAEHRLRHRGGVGDRAVHVPRPAQLLSR